jgi:hypothetical protein
MGMIKTTNLALRFILELCALGALAYWGFHNGQGLALKILLGVGAPLLAAVVWGVFVSPRAARPVPGPVRLLLELLVFGGAALALAAAGQGALGLALFAIYAINRLLMTIWKQQVRQL